MHWLIIRPIGLPLTTAMLSFILRSRPVIERIVSLAGAALLFAAAAALFAATWSAGMLGEEIGRWPAPAGIVLVADLLAAVMVLNTGLTGFLIAVYACADIDAGRERAGFHAFYHVLLAGICGAFLAGDLFNLYVWFEVMLIASFVLLSLGGEKAQLDGAIKYLAINLVSTILFLAGIGVLTMVTGVLGAAAQDDVRRILSFHIISQIGDMILGLALFVPPAVAGTVFSLLHHIIVKANLFLIAGIARRATGSFNLAQMGGLYRSHPWLAVLFLIPAFSLAGIPPLSGFWAKLILIQASLGSEVYVAAAAALVVGLLTVFSMTKIWTYAFWKPHPEGRVRADSLEPRERVPLIAPILVLATLTAAIGLWPEPFVAFSERAAAQLLDPTVYVNAVLMRSRS